MTQALLIAAGGLLSGSAGVGLMSTSAARPAFVQTVDLAVRLLDLVALCLLAFMIVQRRGNRLAGLGLLALGIGCMLLSSGAFWYIGESSPSVSGAALLNGGWVAAFALGGARAARDGQGLRL
jgi:hypothetical protein